MRNINKKEKVEKTDRKEIVDNMVAYLEDLKYTPGSDWKNIRIDTIEEGYPFPMTFRKIKSRNSVVHEHRTIDGEILEEKQNYNYLTKIMHSFYKKDILKPSTMLRVYSLTDSSPGNGFVDELTEKINMVPHKKSIDEMIKDYHVIHHITNSIAKNKYCYISTDDFDKIGISILLDALNCDRSIIENNTPETLLNMNIVLVQKYKKYGVSETEIFKNLYQRAYYGGWRYFAKDIRSLIDYMDTLSQYMDLTAIEYTLCGDNDTHKNIRVVCKGMGLTKLKCITSQAEADEDRDDE